MKLIFTALKKILFWSYERGTWQYDVLCVLILAFIFLAPNWIFNRTGRSSPDHAVATRQVIKGTPQTETQTGADQDSNKGKPESLPGRQREQPNQRPRD
jgi:hypothetical protein